MGWNLSHGVILRILDFQRVCFSLGQLDFQGVYSVEDVGIPKGSSKYRSEIRGGTRYKNRYPQHGGYGKFLEKPITGVCPSECT